MSISERIIRRMGGRITLESTPGAGSTFTVSVAFTAAAGAVAGVRQRPICTAAPIMLVSPQAIEASLIARRLGEWGAQTCVMSDVRRSTGAAAGTHVALRDRRPRARAPADVQRLGEAAQQHASRGIVMIAPADRHELDALKQQGYGDYLVKPLRPASLAARLTVEPSSLSIVPDETAAFAAGAAERKPAEQSLSVLVAEDNEINALLTRSLLVRLGHRPVVAANGAMAVESWIAAESAGTPYDAILMDVQMPEVDGIEATRRIRMREAGRCGRRTPVLALTANTLVEDRYACFEAGMDGYLIKPLDRERLARGAGRHQAAPRAACRLS